MPGAPKDADKDGVKNFAEFKLGTNPRKADTDKDGLKDGDEVTSANDPLDADTDGDGTKDGGRARAASSPPSTARRCTITSVQGPEAHRDARATATCTADDASVGDDDFVELHEVRLVRQDDSADDVSADTSADDDVDLGDGSDGAICDFADVEVGTVLRPAPSSRPATARAT